MGKMVHNTGIYEKGIYQSIVNGTRTREYELWKGMIRRCVSSEFIEKNHSYLDCDIHPDFLYFQVFAEWCNSQVGFDQNFHLDKDILRSGNRLYGPGTCCFVPRVLNNLFTYKKNSKGALPAGVCFHKKTKKYQANIRIDSIQKHLGDFELVEDAVLAYNTAKKKEITRQANIWRSKIDHRVYDAMINYVV